MFQKLRAGAGLAVCAVVIATMPVMAAEKPINLSLFTPVSLAKADDSVSGLRLNFIYGKNTSVQVVDLGLINQTTSASSGLQWGFVNYNEGSFSGLQLGTVGYNKGTAEGLQWSGFNYAGNAAGLQLALVNYAEKLTGFQIGLVNIAKTGGTFPLMVIANWRK